MIVNGRPGIVAGWSVNEFDFNGIEKRRFMNEGELETLIWLVRKVKPKSVLEIGCNSGRTALAILRNVPTIERYYGVDVPPEGALRLLPVQQREVPTHPGALALTDQRFRLLLSVRGSSLLQPEELPRFDAVFIDGDHSLVAVERDYNLARSILNKPGIIIFHDDNGRKTVHVTQVIEKLIRKGRNIIHVNNTWIAYELFEKEISNAPNP